jgi:hypothetical protein
MEKGCYRKIRYKKSKTNKIATRFQAMLMAENS